MAKTESAETADTYDTVASDGDMTSDAATPDGTAESAEEYEAAAQSTAGMATVYKRLPSRRALRELTGILTKWRNFRHRLPAGREAAKTVSLTEEQLQNYYGIKGDSGCNSGWLCADG